METEITGTGNRTETQRDRSRHIVEMPDGSFVGTFSRKNALAYASENGGTVRTVWRPHDETISKQFGEE